VPLALLAVPFAPHFVVVIVVISFESCYAALHGVPGFVTIKRDYKQIILEIQMLKSQFPPAHHSHSEYISRHQRFQDHLIS
jgi:hypothetical protein